MIFTIGTTLTGGSKLTAELAPKQGKPWLHLPATRPPGADAKGVTGNPQQTVSWDVR